MINKSTKKQNYFAGIFVILGVLLIAVAWIWFSLNNHKSYKKYETIFFEPVNGITNDSLIKYNGVEVGKVTGVELDQKELNTIHVYLDIIDTLPITTATYSRITAQGITGMSYIDLRSNNSDKSAKTLVATKSQDYPVIPSKPSLLFSLGEQSQELTSSVVIIANQVKSLLSDENIQHISELVKNLEKVSSNIESQSAKIDRIINNIDKGTTNINLVLESAQQLAKSMNRASDNLADMLQNINENVITDINASVIPNLNQTISTLNKTSINFNQLINTINQNPSSLVREIQPTDLGPGEK